jgi:arylsulfatase A-like enzyme
MAPSRSRRSSRLPRIAAVMLILAALVQHLQAAPGEDKLNVVILLADDMGYGDLACYGGWVKTPNIEKIAAQGALYTQAYASAPVCKPSRAGLFTGLYPARVGVQCNTGDNKVARKRGKGLASETVTLPERLHTLGYYSGLIGKWHLGLKPGMTPLDQGFDEFFGFLGATHLYLPSEEDAKMLRGETPEPEHEKEYLTDALARESEAFLARNKDKPFGLTVAFNAPHSPYQATENYLSRFPTKMKEERRTYGAMIAAMDDAIGRILAALEKEGLAEKTVVFLRQRQRRAARRGLGLERRLRGGRGYLFEGGNRVPMILHWPGHGTAGAKIDAPVSLLDITATTLKLRGCSGRDAGGSRRPRPRALDRRWRRPRAPSTGSSARAPRSSPMAGSSPSRDSRWLFPPRRRSTRSSDVLDQETERADAPDARSRGPGWRSSLAAVEGESSAPRSRCAGRPITSVLSLSPAKRRAQSSKRR